MVSVASSFKSSYCICNTFHGTKTKNHQHNSVKIVTNKTLKLWKFYTLCPGGWDKQPVHTQSHACLIEQMHIHFKHISNANTQVAVKKGVVNLFEQLLKTCISTVKHRYRWRTEAAVCCWCCFPHTASVDRVWRVCIFEWMQDELTI